MAVTTENSFMANIDQGTDKPNSKAPAALSRFAFLIGHWRFEAKFKSPDGEWQIFHGTWAGRYILDGHAIADEYKMLGANEEMLVLGMNFRVYDAAKQIWSIKWLDALAGTWTDLTSEEFGGAKFEGQSVSYIFREPVGASAGWNMAYTRAIYTSVRTWACTRISNTAVAGFGAQYRISRPRVCHRAEASNPPRLSSDSCLENR
jgi:hypothetical protein